MDQVKYKGPERLTLVERFIGLFQLPYLVGSLILASIFGLGSPAAFVFQYLDTFDVNHAYQRFSLYYASQGMPISQSVGVTIAVISLILTFYGFYIIRYMRLKLVAAEPKLLAILPEGEKAYHKAFGRVYSTTPILLLTILEFIAVFPAYIASALSIGLGFFGLVYVIINHVVFLLPFSALFWVYFSSVWGLHKLGKQPLRLKSFYQDRMMGLRPMGSLSLSLAFAYFSVFALEALVLLLSPQSTSVQLYSGLAAVLVGSLGVAMFFLPLNGLHMKMLEQKQLEQERIGNLLAKSMERTVPDSPENSQAGSAEIFAGLKNVITLEVAERRAASIAIWPLDTGILGRLTAIVLSVVVIILSKILTNALGIK